MPITRRRFLQGAGAGAALAAVDPHLRMLAGTNVAWAAGPGDAILVVVQLEGGNDGINTCYPLTGLQRSSYESLRPTLALPDTLLGGGLDPWTTGELGAFFDASDILTVGTNPDGSEYALHPAMTAMHSLYDQGKVALVHGCHYPHPSHSHFRSEEIWYSADPLGTGAQGWLGAYLTSAGFSGTDIPALSIGGSVNPILSPSAASVLSFRSLSSLRFPTLGDAARMQAAAQAIFADTAQNTPAQLPELRKIGETGASTLEAVELYYKPGSGLDQAGVVEALLLDENENYSSRNPLVYDSPLNFGGVSGKDDLESSRLIRDMRHVAATIRADVGARFFHVRTGGFDSHSNQEKGLFHSFLLRQVSEAIAGLHAELSQTVSLPSGYTGYRTESLADKLVILTFSEFGRTREQNSTDAAKAGTDHASAALQMVIGDPVVGGHYGAHPPLDDPRPSDDGDLRMTQDFRDLYGTLLESWLNVPTTDLGPGPGKLLPATTIPDEEGNDYTAFTNLGFIA